MQTVLLCNTVHRFWDSIEHWAAINNINANCIETLLVIIMALGRLKRVFTQLFAMKIKINR